MHFSHHAPAGIVWISPAAFGAAALIQGAPRRAEQDRRWPAMLRKLKGLRKRGRRSIRIVDARCGNGDLLMLAVRRARELGFLAIEGRGVDADPDRIAAARRRLAHETDPAIGLVFEQGEMDRALEEEADFPVDLLLCAGRADEQRRLARLARMAGDTVLWHDADAEGRARP